MVETWYVHAHVLYFDLWPNKYKVVTLDFHSTNNLDWKSTSYKFNYFRFKKYWIKKQIQ